MQVLDFVNLCRTFSEIFSIKTFAHIFREEDKFYVSSPIITTVSERRHLHGNGVSGGVGVGVTTGGSGIGAGGTGLGIWGKSNGGRGSNGKDSTDMELMPLTANPELNYAPSTASGISGYGYCSYFNFSVCFSLFPFVQLIPKFFGN